jgi:alkylhydroperoxidase family enzyme
MARLPYARFEDLLPAKQNEIETLGIDWEGTLNVLKMIANTPGMLDPFTMLGGKLMFEAELSPVYRELAILRIAVLNRARYEWAQHVVLSLKEGITLPRIEAVKDWESSNLFTEEERVILAFTDETVKNTRPSDRTFTAAAAFLSHRALTELALSIGYWTMAALFLNTMSVDIETDFAEKHGDVLPKNEPEW